VSDGVAIARAMAEGGADLIHVEAGQTVHDDRPEYRRGFLTALSDRVRNEARVPTLVGGHLTTIDDANTAVAAGRADLVLLDLPTSRHRASSEQVARVTSRRSRGDHAPFGASNSCY
jgi:anthraniloyl-CoA monooxygenase